MVTHVPYDGHDVNVARTAQWMTSLPCKQNSWFFLKNSQRRFSTPPHRRGTGRSLWPPSQNIDINGCWHFFEKKIACLWCQVDHFLSFGRPNSPGGGSTVFSCLFGPESCLDGVNMHWMRSSESAWKDWPLCRALVLPQWVGQVSMFGKPNMPKVSCGPLSSDKKNRYKRPPPSNKTPRKTTPPPADSAE